MITALCAAVLLSSPAVKEGFIDVEGGKVWYRLVGSGAKTPMIVLHGGPGVPHNYLLSMEPLAKDRPVLFYDQLGCGKSDRPKNGRYWTLDHYRRELQQVRDALGFKKCILYGNSWGTMLATSAKLAGAKGIEAMILSGPALNAHWWKKDAEILLAQLPKADRDAVAKGVTDSPGYKKAVDDYYAKFLCRKTPWPKDVNDTFAGIGMECYMAMCGPNEFEISGNLRDFDVTAQLAKLNVPVLYICGRFDEARPATVRRYQALTPMSKMVVIEKAAHLCMIDQPTEHNRVITNFLKGR